MQTTQSVDRRALLKQALIRTKLMKKTDHLSFVRMTCAENFSVQRRCRWQGFCLGLLSAG